MSKNSALLTIGAALCVSLFFVDGGYAFQTVVGNPPVDFLTLAELYGWTRVPWPVVGILCGTGLMVLIGLGIRRLRQPNGHHAHGHHA